MLLTNGIVINLCSQFGSHVFLSFKKEVVKVGEEEKELVKGVAFKVKHSFKDTPLTLCSKLILPMM